MTTPQQPEQPQQPPPQQPPTSPELVALEDALDQAENTIAPAIAAAIMAGITTQAIMPSGDGDDPRWGVIARGTLYPAQAIAKYAAYGLHEYIRGILMMLLHPLVFRLLTEMDPTGRYPGNLNDLARAASERAIDKAAENLEKATSATGPNAPKPSDIYDLFDSRKPDETRSKTQRKADNIADTTSRWITRDAIFHAQTELAQAIGYTHKRWISERDNRVRPEHRYLDGEAIRITDTFTTPTGNIRYPGDITAPIHLTANCRCLLEWIKRP